MNLVGLSLCVLAAALGTSSANVALPALARVFDARFTDVQWVVMAYLFAIACAVVAFGRLGDVLGRRRVLRGALALYGAASLASAFAPSLGVLVAARAAQGLGAAGMMALATAFVGDLVPKHRTGSAMGLLGTTSSFGTALGPSLGGLLLAASGWRAIFVVHLALATLGLALTGGLPDGGAAASRLRLATFRDRVLGASLAASALVSCVAMTSMVVGPFYLANARGLDARLVGATMSVGSIVAAVTGIPAGRIVDRLGARRVSLLGLGGIATAALALTFRPEHLGLPGYVAPMAALTASYALFQAANNTGVMQRVTPGERGVVAGALGLSRNVGLVAGTAVMGAVFALGAGATDIATAPPHAIARGLRAAYALAAALIAVALFVVSNTKERKIS